MGDSAWQSTSLLVVTRYQQADSIHEEELTHGNKRLSSAGTTESLIGTVEDC